MVTPVHQAKNCSCAVHKLEFGTVCADYTKKHATSRITHQWKLIRWHLAIHGKSHQPGASAE